MSAALAAPGERAWRRLRRSSSGALGLAVLALVVVAALATPMVSSRRGLDVVNTTGNPELARPSGTWLLGTDAFGRSIGAQILWGARTSLLVGLVATALTIVIGTMVGVVGGYAGGWVDRLLGRLTEWFLVIPFLPLAIVLASLLGRSLRNMILVIAITSWPSTARVLRAQTMTLKERLYVERARAFGAGGAGIVRRHILPNLWPLVIANTALTAPVAILTESTLAFLGLGDPFTASWGKMLNDARENGAVSSGAWWWYLPSGIAIVIVVLALTLVGRAVEDALNPRLRERS
jgi:peptide/nickel transport system permease protein